MTQTDDGGPAFPRPHTTADANSPYFKAGHQGMTLRDYFAAKAMQGELSAQTEESGFYADVNAPAILSYRMADAMLKARNS